MHSAIPMAAASGVSYSLKVHRLRETAVLPTRGSHGAAGYDLYSVEDKLIASKDRAVVQTGLAIGVPPGSYGRIAPRSGLALKHGIDVGAGVVDADYVGEVGVVLFNHDYRSDFFVKRGDRIAQLVLECIYRPDVVEVSETACTSRGGAGFGSTGV